MDKLDLHSPDVSAQNIARLVELFPNVLTELRDDEGRPVRAIDFDLLRQELSDHLVEGPQERYQLDWPGKREALFAANAPIAKTLKARGGGVGRLRVNAEPIH
jgi:adenine-specific DNA-methyltransferase